MNQTAHILYNLDDSAVNCSTTALEPCHFTMMSLRMALTGVGFLDVWQEK
jgi:hypothetical protein